MAEFTHLHLHTEYSLLDGACDVYKLVDRVAALGQKSVAMTDHGNIYGAVHFFDAAKAKGVKPILGCELYISKKDDHRAPGEGDENNHLLVLAQNEEGYRNLIRITSEASLHGFYRKPRVSKRYLAEHSAGLIGFSGCLSGELCEELVAGRYEKAKSVAQQYEDIFGKGNFFLEIQDQGLEDEKKIHEALFRLERELDIPLVATNDSHYLCGEDSHAHDVMLCVQTGAKVHDKERFRFDSDQFFVKSADEMVLTFKDSPDVLKRTQEIAERCNLKLAKIDNPFPEFAVPEGHTIDSYFEQVCREGLKKRLDTAVRQLELRGVLRTPLHEYESRLNFEIGIIKQMSYSGYFLIVWDFIKYARDHGIPVGPGRGSATGSLVAYAMEITNIDPMQNVLLFERFLNPERVTMPDIDVDFCQNRRGEVIEYVTRKYGREQVAQIITFNTLQTRAAIKDVGRVLDVPFADVDKISKLVPNVLNISLADSIASEPGFNELAKADPRVDDILKVAARLEGLARNCSIHAAGVVISPEPLKNLVPLYKTSKDEIVTQYDMNGLDKLALLKMDFLGLTTLTLIHDAVNLIEKRHGVRLVLEDLPLDDPKSYEVFCKGFTSGVFQFESPGMRDILRRYQPSRIEDLTALNALYRPGPMDMIDDFIERKWGRRKVEFMLPALEAILKDSLGVIVYQEQVMRIANVLASYSLGEADLLRRAMGKKNAEAMAEQRDRFMSGAAALGHPKAPVGEIFDQMAKFSGYGFNKSHSAAYALVAYQTAYLKTHFPVEFMAALLTSETSKPENVVKYIGECKEMEIRVEPPDVQVSGAQFTPHITPEGQGIRFGLAAVKNVGGNAIESIMRAREECGGRFKTFWQFCENVDLRVMNKRVIESLIKAGALDSLGARAALMKAVDKAMERAQKAQKDAAAGQHGLFGLFNEGPGHHHGNGHAADELPKTAEWEEGERLANEKEVLGFFVSGHPLDKYAEKLRNLSGVIPVSEALERKPPERTWGRQADPADDLQVVGMLHGTGTPRKSKRDGKVYANGHLEDATGKIEVICFARDYERLAEQLKIEAPVLIRGVLMGEEDSAPKIAISGIQPLDAVQIKLPMGVRIRINLDRATEEIFAGLKDAADAAPGPGKVMLHLEKKGEYAVILEPEGMSVAADRGWVERVEELTGKGTVQALG